MNAKVELIQKWLHKAENDLGSAQACAEKGFYDTATFHCQQTAEKAVKGFLTAYDIEFEKTHDLEKLMVQGQQVNQAWAEYMVAARMITPYAVLARYPDEEEPTSDDYAKLLPHANAILNFAKSELANLIAG